MTMIKQHLCQFFAVTALTAGMVLAQAPASGTQPAPEKAPFAHPMFGHEQMMKNLDLTPAQKQQADTIFGNAREKARPIRQEIQQNREALHAAMKANNTAQIERLSTQQGNLMGKALAIRTESMAKFYATLTPEQRMKADQMFDQMKSRMRQRMHERMQQHPSEEE
jgi:Spy/CpxP family protein refolding chaperone